MLTNLPTCKTFPAGGGLGATSSFSVPVKLAGRRFVIPWCYLKLSNERGCENGCDRIFFEFWLPSLYPTEEESPHRSGLRRSEAKRPNPKPDESIVSVLELRALNPTPKDYAATTDQRIANMVKLAGERLKLSRDMGLTYLEDLRYPNRNGRGKWFEQVPDHSLLILCHGSEAGEGLSNCVGYLDLKDWNLHAYFVLDGSAVTKHAKIISGLRTMFQRWEDEATRLGPAKRS